MSRPPSDSSRPEPPPGLSEAAVWIWRMDRGLSAEEQDAFFEWLARDPAHAEALERGRKHWARLDNLADWRPEHSRRPNPDLLAPARPARWRSIVLPFSLAAAACVVGLLYYANPRTTLPAEAPLPRHEDRRILSDTSTAKLNTAARITVLYSTTERRIRLEAGEAFFTVVKDPSRPFIVEAGGVDVRAVGTAFNVRLGAESIDVLVAAGTVAIGSAAAGSTGSPSPSPSAEPRLLQAHQTLSVPLAATEHSAEVATLTRREIQRSLAWQHGLMTFREETLATIIAELNRLNETQLLLLDDSLASSRFSGTIRSDNVDGFVRLLQSAFGAQIERSEADEIRLRAKLDSI